MIPLLWFFLTLMTVVSSLSVKNNNKNNNNNNNNQLLPAHLRVKIASSIAKGERRAEERSRGARDVCCNCHRPLMLCVCSALPRERIPTSAIQILILQHPNEFRKKTFSTVPLISLILQNVTLKVGYTFDPNKLEPIQQCLKQGRKPLLLFPGPTAVSLDGGDYYSTTSSLDSDNSTISHLQAADHDSTSTCDNHQLLIVLDGTWSEANRMATPELVEACQQVQFSSNTTTCIYDSIRKEPQGHCLSTLEACAKALVLLDSNNKMASEYLIQTLKCMVETKQRMDRERLPDPRQKGKTKYEKNKRRRQVERELFNLDNKATATVRRELPNGAVLRSLSQADAAVIDANWEHQSGTSLQTIERRIRISSAGFGIDCNGTTLCGYILQTEDGALGMLHVDEEHRRRGYARALLEEATSVLMRQGDGCVAYIMDGNVPSEQLFQQQGWVRDDPTIKRRSGSRRAKRKWIRAQSVSN